MYIAEKNCSSIYSILWIAILSINLNCSDLVEPDIYTELDTSLTLATESGIRQVLNGAYTHLNESGWNTHTITNFTEMTTDILWNTGGGENRYLVQLNNFTWDPITVEMDILWRQAYKAILSTNIILDNIELGNISDELRTQYTAEARFIRAVSYFKLYEWYGTVPLRLSNSQELDLPRATKDEMDTFLESEFKEVLDVLPDIADVKKYGYPHKSAARGFLCLLYLKNKQWQQAADMCKIIIDNGMFQLVEDYASMFRESGERNSEFIWAQYYKVPTQATSWISGSFPVGFKEDPRTGIIWKNSMRNWQTQYKIFDDYYNSFEVGDIRRDLIMDKYINTAGDTILLTDNDHRALKYYDENAIAQYHGTDLPIIRFSEILLIRAEALNELNGVNQESIDLINIVRNRAQLKNITTDEFSSKHELRDHILDERGWEFYIERKRRNDLIRMGKFIEYAHQRGLSNADEHHVLFPIPQSAMDSNPSLIQNPGY